MTLSQSADVVPLVLAMVIAAWRAWRGDLWAIAVLVLLGLGWLRVDKLFEGPVIVHITEAHGLVVADLVGVVALAFAGLAVARQARSALATGRTSRHA